jgi:hypothetical protein
MLKKLQNLLFEDEDVTEDEDIDEEEEKEEVVETPRRRKKAAPEPEPEFVKPAVQAKQEPERMQRIDVTQAVPAVNQQAASSSFQSQDSVFRKPAPTAPRPVQRPTAVSPAPAAEKPKASLGITVDEIDGGASPVQRAKPVTAGASAVRPTAAKPAERRKPAAPVYEFQPVISPIFGVDEKDLSAVQTTAKAAVTKKDDENISKIISPIYGVTRDAEPTSIQKTVEKSNKMAELAKDTHQEANEDEVPDFSLDDILKVRDEEYAAESKQEPLFPDLDLPADKEEKPVDNTTVIPQENVSPFGTVRKPAGSTGAKGTR